MVLLDAYALIALLAEEPAADQVEHLVRSADAAITVVNLTEALDISQRVHGLEPEELGQTLDPILDQGLAVIGPTLETAWRAAALRLTHYDRKTSALSLADCLLLATASSADRIATSDPPLARAARAESIAVVALPDSAGRKP